jgi:hypothetical protein
MTLFIKYFFKKYIKKLVTVFTILGKGTRKMDPVMGSQNSLYDLLHHLNVLPSAVLMTAELIKTEKCLKKKKKSYPY